MQTFQTPAPMRLRIELPKGRIQVVAEDTAETRVELIAVHGDPIAQQWIDEAEVAQHGDEVVVRIHKRGLTLFGLGGSIEALIHVPTGSDASLSTGSGRIETAGRLGAITASTGSGAIRLAESAEARAQTGSGDIDTLPDSTTARSRTSLINFKRCHPAFRI